VRIEPSMRRLPIGHDDAAEDVGIDGGVDLHVAALAGLEPGDKLAALGVVERVRGGDPRGDLAAFGGGDLGKGAGDVGQRGEPAVGGDHAEEVARQLGQAKHPGDPVDRRGGGVAADLRVAEQRSQVGRFAHRLGELLEVLLHGRGLAAVAGKVVQGRSVAPCQAGRDAGGMLHAWKVPLS
jgi:hypothetical protein